MRTKLPLVLSITALAVALLGATPLGRAAKGLVIPVNSVGSPQLKADAVSSAKVKNGSLLAADFRLGQLPRGPIGRTGASGAAGTAGPAGPQGPAGATGAKGDKGDKGDPATPNWAVITPAGGVQYGSGVVKSELTGAGTFRVTFARDITHCAIVATPERSVPNFFAGPSSDVKEDVIVYAVTASGTLSEFSIAAFC